ncbi:MAG: hypothetical protein ABI435_01540 [Pseudolysinimonas sp.]
MRTIATASLWRALTFVGLATALAVTANVPATAADDPVDAVVHYQGPATLVDDEGTTVGLTVDLVVDCTAGSCTALATVADGELTVPLTNDHDIPLIDGRASVSLPEFGSLCDLRWVGAGVLDIAATATRATVTRSSAAGGPVTCGDGSEGSAAAATISGTLAYVSGSVCVLNGSCPTPSLSPTLSARPIATPTVATIPNDPSILSQLPTVDHVLNIQNGARAAGGALVLAVLVALPSALLDSATERIAAWIERRRERRGRVRDAAAALPLTIIGWPLALIGLVVAAVGSAFVDPHFGFDLGGLRVLASVLASFVVAIALGWAFVALLMRATHPASQARVEFRPLTLLVVVGAVVFSRLTGFEPGIVFGLVAGVGFGAALATAERARAALATLGYLLVIALVAWVGYSMLAPALGAHPEWPLVLARETLSAIAITGLSALPIAMLPIRGLSGHAIWAWNRVVWGLTYLLAGAGFLLVVMPLPDSWLHVQVEWWAWGAAYLSYAAIAVLVWLVVTRPWRPAISPSDGHDSGSSTGLKS